MFTVFGVTIVLYFIKILSGSRNSCSRLRLIRLLFLVHILSGNITVKCMTGKARFKRVLATNRKILHVFDR